MDKPVITGAVAVPVNEIDTPEVVDVPAEADVRTIGTVSPADWAASVQLIRLFVTSTVCATAAEQRPLPICASAVIAEAVTVNVAPAVLVQPIAATPGVAHDPVPDSVTEVGTRALFNAGRVTVMVYVRVLAAVPVS